MAVIVVAAMLGFHGLAQLDAPAIFTQLYPCKVYCKIPPYGIMRSTMTSDGPRLIARLSRIEGQVRGIAKMVADGRYCIDVLTQVRAARAALAKVETAMLKDHLGHCIEGAISSGDVADQRAKAAELIALLEHSR